MEGGREQQGPPERHAGKNLIKIPSYQEVFGTAASSSSSSTPLSYNPPLQSADAPAASTSTSSSGSFSQAFSFLKSSEFYSASSSASAPQSKSAILVSHRQRGNPSLKHVRNARWAFADVVPDYVLRQSSCALYLRT